MTPRLGLKAEAIVDTAIEMIRADGHESLSMRSLAARMEVTAPAFYDHFASRDELLRACAARGYGLLESRLMPDETTSAMDMAWAASRGYVGFALDEPELFRLMFLYRPGSIEVPADNELPEATAVFDAMIDNLARAIDEGDLSPGDPVRYGLALWAAVHGVATVALLVPDLDAEELADAVVGPMLRGWSPSP